jgi:hypothetical protein
MDVTAEALRVGIEMAQPGNWTWEISKAIEEYVLSQHCEVVREYTGHGIGQPYARRPADSELLRPACLGTHALAAGYDLCPGADGEPWRLADQGAE